MKVMETMNVVIDESSNSGSEKGIEEFPKEILPASLKPTSTPASPSTPGTPNVVEDSVDIPTSPN